MLTSTFEIFKEKFAENIRILTPIIIIEAILFIVQILSNGAAYNEKYISLLVLAVIAIVLSIIHWLIYTPAAFRTFQRRAEGENLTVQDSIAFQKNNKWNYIVLMFWIYVYMIWYGIISILPIVGGMYFGLDFVYVGGVSNLLIGSALMFVGVGFGLYMIYVNYTKVFFPLNVYFGKNLSPRESVRESVYLGTQYRNQIWKYITGVFLIGILGFVLIVAPALAFPKGSVFVELWRLIVSLFFITPMMYIYMSKAYLSLIVEDSVKGGNASIIPTKEAEIIEIVEISE